MSRRRITLTGGTAQEEILLSELKSLAKKNEMNALLLSTDDETDLVEWVQSHELLYDKSKREYKHTHKEKKIVAGQVQ